MTTEGEGTPSGERNNGADSGGQKKKSTEKPHLVAYIEAGCAIMLVLITGTYTYYSAGQLHKMKRSVEAAEGANRIAGANLEFVQQQFRMDERPYLSPEARGGTSIGDKTAIIVVQKGVIGLSVAVDLRDVGKSPAVETFVSPTEYKLGPREDVRREVQNYVPEYSNSRAGSVVLMNAALTPESRVRILSAEELRRIKDGTWELYIVGGVTYRDIFSPRIPPYETTYCYHFVATGMPLHSCPFKPPAFGSSIK